MDIEISSVAPTKPINAGNEVGLKIILCRANDPAPCSFWVGLYKSGGTGTTAKFLESTRLDEAFRYLGEQGLNDNQPLMFSDNSGAVHRQYFLLPQSRVTKDKEKSKSLILSTVQSLGQKEIGLYLAPKLFDQPETESYLGELIDGFAKLKIDTLNLLTTDIGVNQLLNVSLKIKEGLRSSREIWVLH